MKQQLDINTTGKKSKYAAKKQRMKSGSYTGTSPFYNNNSEWQYLHALHTYPHLVQYNIPRPKKRILHDTSDTRTEN